MVGLGQMIYDYKNPRTSLGEPLKFDALVADRNEGFELYENISNSSNSISTTAKVRSMLSFSLEGHVDKSKVRLLLVNNIRIEEF